MAAAPKSLKMARLQSAIDKILGNRGIEHFVVIIIPAMFTISSSMKWHRVGPESLTSGFFRNLFLWGVCNEGATNVFNLWAKFIHGGETSASNADDQAFLEVVVNLPLEDESIINLNRMEIVASVLLPKVHGFLNHIRDHTTSFNNYKKKWRNLEMTNASRQGAKGAYQIQFLDLQFSKDWRAQRSLTT